MQGQIPSSPISYHAQTQWLRIKWHQAIVGSPTQQNVSMRPPAGSVGNFLWSNSLEVHNLQMSFRHPPLRYIYCSQALPVDGSDRTALPLVKTKFCVPVAAHLFSPCRPDIFLKPRDIQKSWEEEALQRDSGSSTCWGGEGGRAFFWNSLGLPEVLYDPTLVANYQMTEIISRAITNHCIPLHGNSLIFRTEEAISPVTPYRSSHRPFHQGGHQRQMLVFPVQASLSEEQDYFPSFFLYCTCLCCPLFHFSFIRIILKVNSRIG